MGQPNNSGPFRSICVVVTVFQGILDQVKAFAGQDAHAEAEAAFRGYLEDNGVDVDDDGSYFSDKYDACWDEAILPEGFAVYREDCFGTPFELYVIRQPDDGQGDWVDESHTIVIPRGETVWPYVEQVLREVFSEDALINPTGRRVLNAAGDEIGRFRYWECKLRGWRLVNDRRLKQAACGGSPASPVDQPQPGDE